MKVIENKEPKILELDDINENEIFQLKDEEDNYHYIKLWVDRNIFKENFKFEICSLCVETGNLVFLSGQTLCAKFENKLIISN